MSNNTTVADTGGPDYGSHNKASNVPIYAAIFFSGILAGYTIFLLVMCVVGGIKSRQVKQRKRRDEQARSDNTTDIPLQELDPAGSEQNTTNGGQERNPWAEDEDTEVEEPTASNSRSASAFPSASPPEHTHHRTNARLSIINPRTSSTPESSLARVRTHSNPTNNASHLSLVRTRTRSETLSAASDRHLTRSRTRSNPQPYKPEPQPPIPPNLPRPTFSPYEAYPLQPFSTSGVFHRTMGTKKLDTGTWLTLDHQFLQYHGIRSQILAEDRKEVLQVLEGAEGACYELLDAIVQFVCQKYFNHFMTRRHSENRSLAIFNLATGEHFYLDPPDHRYGPLEICAKLTMDDFNILMPDENGEHRLQASATLFPAAWRLRERMNWTVTQLHDPVPGWKSSNSYSVEKYFTRLQPGSEMERSAYFIQIAPPSTDRISKASLFIQSPEQMYADPNGLGILRPEDILIRRERHTFIRLMESHAVCFAVHTSMTRLMKLSDEECYGLAMEIRAWPEEVAQYRCADIWGDVVLSYCDERCRNWKVTMHSEQIGM